MRKKKKKVFVHGRIIYLLVATIVRRNTRSLLVYGRATSLHIIRHILVTYVGLAEGQAAAAPKEPLIPLLLLLILISLFGWFLPRHYSNSAHHHRFFCWIWWWWSQCEFIRNECPLAIPIWDHQFCQSSPLLLLLLLRQRRHWLSSLPVPARLSSCSTISLHPASPDSVEIAGNKRWSSSV